MSFLLLFFLFFFIYFLIFFFFFFFSSRRRHTRLQGDWSSDVCSSDLLRLIRELGIDVIFSTYPIPSAHVIGSLLSRFSGKPWVADFRDPMWDDFRDRKSVV